MTDNDQKARLEESRVNEIRAILKEYGEDFDLSTWEVHGKLVVYHTALERIATKASIVFDPPVVHRAEAKEAVMCVTGRIGAKSEWSFGEAVIDVNYKVSGAQKPYVYAMAEKRGKDRVILKLISLHGDVYSEEEADEFKQQFDSNAAANKLMDKIDLCKTAAEVEALMKSADVKVLIGRMTKPHGDQVVEFGRKSYKLWAEREKIRGETRQPAAAGATTRQPAAANGREPTVIGGPTNRQPAASPPPPPAARLPENASDRRGDDGGFGKAVGTVDETLAKFKDELRYCHTNEEVQVTCESYREVIEGFTPPDQKIANGYRRERLDEIRKADEAERMKQ